MLLEENLIKRKNLGNFRELPKCFPLIDLSSNDFLGLARSPLLKSKILQEFAQSPHGLGSTGSRLLTGNSIYAEELEQSIANFHGYEAGVLFNCGYMANVGLLSSLATSQDSILFDAHIHASTHDGIRLSGASSFPFKHNDLDHLEMRLKQRKTRNCFVCIESLYSTDSSKAPLKEITSLSKKYDARLIVDEAHAIGVCGPQGKGLVSENSLSADIFATVLTFGKALGIQGAIVLGSHALKDTLINYAHSFIYTTALPPFALMAIKNSYAVFPNLNSQRTHISHLIQLYQNLIPSHTTSHIQSIIIPGNVRVKAISQELAKEGFDVRPLTSPTVKRGQERLRLCLHAFNTTSEISACLYKIRELLCVK